MHDMYSAHRQESKRVASITKQVLPIIGRDFAPIVSALISKAQKSVDVIIFDWRWYSHDVSNPVQVFTREIIGAKNRGVLTRIICNASEIRIKLKSLGLDVRSIPVKKLMHVKLIIIDGHISVLGSHNYTIGGFVLNLEASIMVDDVDTAFVYSSFFDNLWQGQL